MATFSRLKNFIYEKTYSRIENAIQMTFAVFFHLKNEDIPILKPKQMYIKIKIKKNPQHFHLLQLTTNQLYF